LALKQLEDAVVTGIGYKELGPENRTGELPLRRDQAN